ncbi:MAG: hypothetical protein IKG36_02835 [Mycoplasmataceae bacterium]|nr:hypothetical protein [Mycoplasmataceae bacterium]
MKIRKNNKLFLSLSLATLLPIFSVISCSQRSTKNNSETTRINYLKNDLDQILNKNMDNILNQVSITNSDISSVNFFNVLEQPSIVSNYFSLNNFELEQLNENQKENYSFNFQFLYGVKDSYGIIKKPYLSNSKKTIVIPILVYLFDSKNNIEIKKYIDLFELNIADSIITDEDSVYNGSQAKQLVFQNRSFQAVPKNIVDKYLDFIYLTYSDGYQQQPIYSKINQWKGKTLSEVRQISQAIVAPDNYIFEANEYEYSIVNSYFAGPERNYAYFVMKISLDDSNDSISKLISDAKNIYNLSFEKEYSLLNETFSFKKPNDSDISSYKENNKELLKPLISIAQNNILLYTPEVLNLNLIKEKTANDLVTRFKGGIKDFVPPKSFIYESNNGQIREISFLIDSLETTSNEKTVQINLKMIIDKGELSTFEIFSKNFDLETLKFV